MKPPKVVELTAADLSPRGQVYCPHPKAHMVRWDTHPRVFFLFDKNGEAICPYCSTQYKLKKGEKIVPQQ